MAATEEALLAARNANISVRELKRVLGEERAEAAKAAEKAAADFADGAGGAAAGGEADGEANTARYVLCPSTRTHATEGWRVQPSFLRLVPC